LGIRLATRQMSISGIGNQTEFVYAELEIARLPFAHSQATFEFRKPISAKASDYDLRITYPDGVVACADTKCKIEETEITLGTIKGSLVPGTSTSLRGLKSGFASC
jgi:hypothetical protein